MVETAAASRPQADERKDKSGAPPTIITVDTKGKNAANETDEQSSKSSDIASQARTPKHANKVKGTHKKDKDSSRSRPAITSGPPSQYGSGMQQVSPSGNSNRFFPPPPFGNGPGGVRFSGSYDQRFPGEFPRYDQGPYRGPVPMFPPRPFSGNEFHGRHPAWGPPPSFAMPGHPSMHPTAGMHGGNPGGTNNTMSRAVSSSFDRSVKSRDDNPKGHGGEHPHSHVHHEDQASISEDASWKMLNQVHSVDEEELRKRLQGRDRNRSGDHQPASNSSSLTNSPTDGIEKKPNGPDAKMQSSLDSLSSVASTQEPMDIAKDSKTKALSPSPSTGSLDLMKCPSGSSHLLLPLHQRSLSQFSFPTTEGTSSEKREHDEIRGDIETPATNGSELRKPPSGEPPFKKSRAEGKANKKSSPLSIECSPPSSPVAKRKEAKVHQPQPLYPRKSNQSPGFYDQPPSYTYSMDSTAPTMHSKYRQRPPSSASVDNPPGVSQLPSWDIQPQDSFGGASVSGGHGLMSSFSFPHESLGIQNAYSSETVGASGRGGEQTLESRNQSFDGGHYGNIGRSDSMMSYERHGAFEGRAGPAQNTLTGGYPVQFPPHAPSWGSASSFPQNAMYGVRGTYPMMARNYSEDSGRTTPPTGRVLPPSFQPPPEFRAPPSMVNKAAPKSTIITSPYQPTPKNGPFGWNKEEDARLTEIMKKYKSPRDWVPIAKEHGRGRSPKECHERWIRYLKPGVRKGQWTDAEDAIVMEVVTKSKEQPFTRWSDLAQRLPGRVGKQIRDRWVNHLNPAINHLPFSREDDMLLWEGHKQVGKRWVEIATKFFNSTRSENHIKNRWYSASFKKFIVNEFGLEAYTGVKAKPKKSTEKKPKKTSSPRRSQQSKGASGYEEGEEEINTSEEASQIEAV